jgi:tetratricopeptide (TPR) repeat protein
MVPEKRDVHDAIIDQLSKTATATPLKTDQERIDAVLQTPFFMNTLTVDPESNEVLQALQSLQLEGTPEEVAENFKVQGNTCYLEGKPRFQDAIIFYTKGILANSGNNNLDSILYCNRAAVHLSLSNYGKVLNDCAMALKLNPKNLKAYYRSTRALYALDRVDEGIDCCVKGLEIDNENANLISELTKLKTKKENLAAMKLKREEKAAAMFQQERELSNALKSRGYKLETIDDQPLVHPNAPSAKISLTATGLMFPVLFLYPEYNQSDFIAEFHETDTFFSHFQTMFADPAPWDVKCTYLPETIEWFFEEAGKLVPVLRRVKALSAPNQSAPMKYVHVTLRDVLSDPAFVVTNGVCKFILLVRDSDFAMEFKKKYRNK